MPDALTLIVLGLAAYRLTRLAGWDDFPLAAKIRAWVIGERWVPLEPVGWIESAELTDRGLSIGARLTERGAEILSVEGVEPSLPGKQPSSEAEGVRPAYDRPTLAHLVHCPFCASFWISLVLYGLWLWQPHWTIVAMMPFVLSGVVGLIAKNLDP